MERGKDGLNVGKMSLAELRRSVGSESSENLLDLVRQKREKEKVEELRQLKIKHQQLRARKQKEAMEIQKVMLELEKKKKLELELRLQKEKAKMDLEKLDKSHLTKIGSEKKRELEVLSKERMILQEKEAELLKQVSELEGKLIEQEELSNQRKKEIDSALSKKAGTKAEKKQAQLLEIARIHGERTHSLATQRQQLEQERKKLEESMSKLKRKDPLSPFSRGEESLQGGQESGDESQKIALEVEKVIAAQEEKLALMRMEMEKEQQELKKNKYQDDRDTDQLRPIDIDQSLPFTMQAESFLNEWLQQDPRRQATMSVANQQLESCLKSPKKPIRKSTIRFDSHTFPDGSLSRDGTPQSQEHGNNDDQVQQVERDEEHEDEAADEEGENSSERGKQRPKRMRPKRRRKEHDPALEREIKDMKQEYMRMGVDNPMLWKEIQDLEAQLYTNYVPQPSPLFPAVSMDDSHYGHPLLSHRSNFHSPGSPRSFQPAQSPRSPLLDYQLIEQQKMLKKQEKAIKKLEKEKEKEKAKQSTRKLLARQRHPRRKRHHRPETTSDDDGSFSHSSSCSSSPNGDSDTESTYSDTSNSRRRRRQRGGGRHRRGSRQRPQESQHRGVSFDLEKKQMELEEQRRLFSQTMEGLTRKLQILAPAGEPGASVMPTGFTLPTGGVNNEFMEELSMLERIPRDTDLYHMQVEHLKMMRKMKLEIEELKQEQHLASVKEEIERKRKEDVKQAEFEEIKKEQERKLELARLRRMIAKESSQISWNGTSGAPGQLPYDPSKGFVVYLDYVMGIPKRFGFVRLVFCIYEGQDAKTGAKALPVCETEPETPTKHTALFVARKKFQKVPPLTDLRFVMELQNVVEDEYGGKSFQGIGWTVLNLFHNPQAEGATMLNEGAFRLPIMKPPFKPADLVAYEEMLTNKKPEDASAIQMNLFVRLVNSDNSESAANFVVDPSITQHMYTNPFEKVRAAKEKASVSKKKTKKKATSKKSGTSVTTDTEIAERDLDDMPKGKANENDEDDSSDLASVADSIVSNASMARSVLSSVSSLNHRGSSSSTTPKKKYGYAVAVERVAFDDESPACPVFVRVALLPSDKFYAKHSDDGKMWLSMQSEPEEFYDYSNIRDGMHVWQTSARDVRLSSGHVVWKQEASNSTFFDGLVFKKSSLLVFKVFERRAQGHIGGGGVDGEMSEEDEDEGEGDVDNSHHLLGWAVKPVLDHDGEIELHQSTFDLELAREPVGLPFEEDKVEWLNARISVRLFSGSQNKRKRGRTGSVSSRISSTILEEEEEDLVSEAGSQGRSTESEAWVEVAHPPQARNAKHFVRGDDGYDVYIDGCRFLPDYVTISSVHVKVMSPAFELIGKESTGIAEISKSAYSPRFGLRMEFRGEEVANPASTLIIRVDTVDRHTQKAYAIGYALLNVFCSAGGSSEQPRKATQKEYVLNAGAFQIPLFQSQPNTESELHVGALEEAGALRVPCATVLVRIHPAKKSKDGLHILNLSDFPENEWEKRGLVIPAPPYAAPNPSKKGKKENFETYDSTRCVPLECERKLYHNLMEREDVLVGELAVLAKRDKMEEDKRVDVMEDEELKGWMNARLERPHGLIGLAYVAQYNVESGFKTSIDRLIHVKKTKSLFKVIFSLGPPASYYGDPRLTDDVAFTLTHDWDAAVGSPRFLDDMHTFRDIPFDPKLFIIVHVKEIIVKKLKADVNFTTLDHSWGILPVFTTHNGAFVRTGVHQVALFDGSPNIKFIRDLQTGDKDVSQAIESELAKSRSKRELSLNKSHASAFIRLVDAQIADCVSFPLQQATPAMVPDKVANKYKFDAVKVTAPGGKKAYGPSFVPKGQTVAELEKVLNKHFSEATDIQNYTF